MGVSGAAFLHYACLALAIVFNVAAYAVLKFTAHRPHDGTWFALFAAGLALGAINVFFFTTAIRGLRLSAAYPAFAGASIAAITLVSGMLFAEPVKPVHLLGAVLVFLGIVALAR